YLIDEPLRRKVERDMNARLKDYSVRIGKLDFHPIGMSLDLKEMYLYQNAHPDPPIAYIPDLHASVHWKAMLHRRLVGDFQINDPKLYLNLANFAAEAKNPTPVKDKGWQDALYAAYPLLINRFAISNADITYADRGPFKPLHLTKVNFEAENIRNVRSEKGVYPSPVEFTAVVFDTGKATFQGYADFLAKPYMGLKGDLDLQQITLDYFKPITERYQFDVRKGTLSAKGAVEYNSEIANVQLGTISVKGLDADYLHQDVSTAPTEKATKEAGKTARQTANKSDLEFKLQRLEIDGRIGYVNQVAQPKPYRVFLDNANIVLENLSNHFKEGPARAHITGRFQGSGATRIDVAFRPEDKGPDVDLNLAIENTDMAAMSDLMRSYANFDVAAGNFSMFSEIKIRQGKIDGYVKPLFSGLEVVDQRPGEEESFWHKAYVKVIQGLSNVLKNRPRQEIATKVPITGDVESPQTSTWQMIVKLVENAFFRAILPGFDRELQGGKVQVTRREQNGASQQENSAPQLSEKTAPQQRPNTARNTQEGETTVTR
ncbi:MAG TPA: DUF748 domain-containing protein, partial [Candidatus Binatia bacterium]|nr:DUF748 domain-containing protein [Candidatus Binatia bacterium]